MDHIEIVIEESDESRKEIFVALLSSAGFSGFEEEEAVLKAYIIKKEFDENYFNILCEQNSISYLKSEIKEKNWNEKWEADFEPLGVDIDAGETKFCFVRAVFHQPDTAYLHDLIITPKMSFGTGHHATTHLMIEQMSAIDFAGKTVIDFGTGTGILAILAEKLGAASVLAIDCDDWSLRNAAENIAVNGCERIRLEKGESIAGSETAEIILANINTNIITANLGRIRQSLKANATVLFSGIMFHDEEVLSRALHNHEFEIIGIFRRGDWLALKAVAQ